MVSCRAYYGVYMTKDVSSYSCIPASKNDGGPHRNCLTRVIRAPSTFLRKL